MKTAEEIQKIVQEILKDSNGSWSDMVTDGYEAGYKDAIQSYASHPMSEPTVEQLREAAKNHPDTFLAGALYILDNGMGTATQYSSGAIHSLGEFPTTKSMSAEQVLFTFIQAIKDEFKDGNWDYLDFIAKRVLPASPTVKAEGWVSVEEKQRLEQIIELKEKERQEWANMCITKQKRIEELENKLRLTDFHNGF